ncbi:hypothetical protein FDG2_6442 [Candidatus Protofrankia californiensis]|uniref:Uncharacterized protein n=1 Tax=Candidatus Protofrankia californiensis TaxID=1839754 RepID=A0A1C3PGX6_9ACTN|nr:hypothetical protein FDG2_6442 [Candidatus Protofrankia californiensis]
MLHRMRTRLTPVTTLTILIGVITLLVMGCSSSHDAPPADGASAASGPAGTAQANRTVAVDVPAASRTTSFRAPGSAPGTIDVGFVGLRVDGRLTALTVVWTPKYTNAPRDKEISVFDMFGAHSPAVTLVDSVNLKRYVVVQDSRNIELGASGPRTKTVNNTPVSASYTFAAPPADVRTLDVYADDRLLFDDVPVSR